MKKILIVEADMKEYIEKYLQDLAAKYNGTMVFESDRVLGGPGFFHFSNFVIRILHRNVDLKIDINFGMSNVAKYEFRLEPNRRIPPIHIESRDHFSRLFWKRKQAWKFNMKKGGLKNRLRELLDHYQLTKMNDDHLFTPEFTGIEQGDGFYFKAVYNLSFDEKEQSFEPVINFHLSVIDYLVDNYHLPDNSEPNQYFQEKVRPKAH